MKKIISLILALTMLLGAALTLASCTDTSNEPVVKTVDVKLTDESYAFVAKKGNTQLVNDFNSFLKEIKENGVKLGEKLTATLTGGTTVLKEVDAHGNLLCVSVNDEERMRAT